MEKNTKKIKQPVFFYHLSVFNDCRCEIVVCFIDKDGIDDHPSLNIFFFSKQKTKNPEKQLNHIKNC